MARGTVRSTVAHWRSRVQIQCSVAQPGGPVKLDLHKTKPAAHQTLVIHEHGLLNKLIL